jgi:hypothetical protein
MNDALESQNRALAEHRVELIKFRTAGMDKGQVSNRGRGPKPGLNTDKLRVSSLSSAWMD